MRRRRKNPNIPMWLVGASVATVGIGAFFFFRTPPLGRTLVTTTGQTFTTSTDPFNLGQFVSALDIDVGDCIMVKNGVNGVDLPGVPAGENSPMKVTSSAGAGSTTVTAVSIDPRSVANTARTIPVVAISVVNPECAQAFQ